MLSVTYYTVRWYKACDFPKKLYLLVGFGFNEWAIFIFYHNPFNDDFNVHNPYYYNITILNITCETKSRLQFTYSKNKTSNK